jgi:hypothetical protein
MSKHSCDSKRLCTGCESDESAVALVSAIRSISHGDGLATGFEALCMAISGPGNPGHRDLCSAISASGGEVATALRDVADGLNNIAAALKR